MSYLQHRRKAFRGGVPAPLHWWDLDDLSAAAGGGLYDEGDGTTFNLADVNGPSTSSGTAPDGGDCIDMSAGQYLENSGGANIAYDGTGDSLSWSIWGNMDVLASTFNMLIGWRGTPDRLLHTLFFNDTTDAHAVSMGDTDNDYVNPLTTTPSVTTGAWYHIAATYEATSKLLTLYVDGVERTSSTYTLDSGRPTASMPFAIGVGSWEKQNAAYQHDGKVWACGIWDEDIGAGGVSHLYNGGTGRKYADLTIV